MSKVKTYKIVRCCGHACVIGLPKGSIPDGKDYETRVSSYLKRYKGACKKCSMTVVKKLAKVCSGIPSTDQLTEAWSNAAPTLMNNGLF